MSSWNQAAYSTLDQPRPEHGKQISFNHVFEALYFRASLLQQLSLWSNQYTSPSLLFLGESGKRNGYRTSTPPVLVSDQSTQSYNVPSPHPPHLVPVIRQQISSGSFPSQLLHQNESLAFTALGPPKTHSGK